VFGLPLLEALDRSGELLVSLRLLGLALPVQDTGSLQMLPRASQRMMAITALQVTVRQSRSANMVN
jgi:hypothetical protein